ncbi:YigZ/IMPACT family protein [Halorhabdus sp. SVX81]|nr:YigZ/IMPACT family protein [Halorhabdus sp. SVX81]
MSDLPEGFRRSSRSEHTSAGVAEGRFTISGSEFIGHARPAGTVDAAEAFVGSIRAEYDDATHNVPAYRVRADPLRAWASDDDEPSGSAGKPALNVLDGQELENVAVVVTRYFGGTELGVGGLVSAYSRAVKEAVDDADVREVRPHERVAIEVEYDDSGTVRSILESEGVEFEASYEERVAFVVRVPTAELAALRDRVGSATSGRATVETSE